MRQRLNYVCVLENIKRVYYASNLPLASFTALELNEPTTWSEATSVLEVNDPKLGRVRVSLWKDLHFRQAATRPMLIIMVERLDGQGNMMNVQTFVVGLGRRRNATARRSLGSTYLI